MADKLIRCPEGHIYDAAAHEVCPECGAEGANAEPSEAPEPVADHLASKPQKTVPPVLPEGSREATGNSSSIKIAVSLAAIALVAFLVWPDDQGSESVQGANDREAVNASGGIDYFGHKWRTTIPGPNGGFDCVNDVKSDGSYRLLDGCPPPFNGETGRFWLEPDGAWRLQADTGRFDQGVMVSVDSKNMRVTGMAGTAVWRRVD